MPRPPSRPRNLRSSGSLAPVFLLSTLAWVRPSTSPSSMAKCDHLTMLDHAVVAAADQRAERLAADRLGQEDPVGRHLHGGAGGGDRSAIIGVAVAAPGLDGGEGLLGAFEQQRLDLDVVGPVEVGDVDFERGAGLQADGGAVELLGVGDAQAFAHHEGLAGEEVHRRLAEAEIGVARQGLLGVADQHVDLAGGEHGEAHLRGETDDISPCSASPSAAAAMARHRATSRPCHLPAES